MKALLLKVFLIFGCFTLWFYSQSLLASRANVEIQSRDYVEMDWSHQLLASPNLFLHEHENFAQYLLILSSLGVDFLTLYILYSSLKGPNMKPFLAMMLIFILRQVSQFLWPLPIPQGMIWRDPHFPSLFVTYGVANDFFFSGHTALSVLGALVIWNQKKSYWGVLAILLALFEIFTVLILRAHWFVDVAAGILVSAFVYYFLIHRNHSKPQTAS